MTAEHDLFEKLFEINGTEGKLNLDRIREHIISCIVELDKVLKVDEHEVMKQLVLFNAVQLLVKEDKTNEADVDLLISQFDREKEKTCNTCNWFPLHWAIVLGGKVIHALFLGSPTCLTQHLNTAGKACPRFTPADLLVMQKNPNVSLVRYFDMQNPRVFKSSRFCLSAIHNHAVFPLHLAAKYSENLELLQYLLQTHIAAVTYKGDGNGGMYPLSHLIWRAPVPTYDLMLQCLLDASSDNDVIGHAIHEVLCAFGKRIENTGWILEMVEILLNANPSAVEYVGALTNETLFHSVCRLLKDPICTLSVMKLLLVHYPSGLKVTATVREYLPLYVAVEHSTVEVVQFMLQVYPTSIDSTAGAGLILSALKNMTDAGMVPYLCSIAPQLLHTLSRNRKPLAYLCDGGAGKTRNVALNGRYAKMLAMCETDPTIVRDETLPGPHLPLFILMRKKLNRGPPTSDFADCFRLLLRLHPSAAGALNSDGVSLISYAIQKEMDDYFIRLLLSASNNAEHKALLSEYIYKHKRSLLFLSYFAIPRSPRTTIFARLRQSHPESLKVVASFL